MMKNVQLIFAKNTEFEREGYCTLVKKRVLNKCLKNKINLNIYKTLTLLPA